MTGLSNMRLSELYDLAHPCMLRPKTSSWISHLTHNLFRAWQACTMVSQMTSKISAWKGSTTQHSRS